MSTRRLLGSVATLGATAMLLAACGGAGTSDTGASTSGGSQDSNTGDFTVGLVMLQGDDYFKNIEIGVQAAAKDAGATVIAANSNNDPGTEVSTVQNLVQRQVGAMLIQPVSGDASVAAMKLAVEAGIPVICYGNCQGPTVSPDLVKGVAQSDNTDLGAATGRVAAEYIKAELGGKAKIGILNCDTAAETCKLRKAGFMKALEDAGVDAEFVSDQEGYLADKATPVATNMLSANPEINIIWASNEGGTVGGVTAVRQAGAKVVVFGTDISEQIAQFLISDENILQATTGQDPVSTAKVAFEMAQTAASGGTNTPLETLVPGITYNRAEPKIVEEYLSR